MNQENPNSAPTKIDQNQKGGGGGGGQSTTNYM